MSDNRKVAGQLMGDAARVVLKDRPGIHGSAENSFEMIGDLWTVYIRHTRRVRGSDTILPEDVAEMMAMLKKARKVYGDRNNRDNDVDDIGYTALSGMLRLPDPDAEPMADLDKLDPVTQAPTPPRAPTSPEVPFARHTGINTPPSMPKVSDDLTKIQSATRILDNLYGDKDV